MNFTGVVIEIRNFPIGKPSVRVNANHDSFSTWAEWQTDLRGNKFPVVGDRVKVTTYGPIKIAF